MVGSVGLARSLYFYAVDPYWRTFLQEVGAEVVLCDLDRQGLPAAANRFENELCLPIKYFLAQIERLIDTGVDYLFVPLVASLDPGILSCPKIIMTPDLVRLYFADSLGNGRPKLLSPTLYGYHGTPREQSLADSALETADALGVTREAALRAVRRATERQHRADATLQATGRFQDQRGRRRKPPSDGPRILLLGHRYTVHDRVLSNEIADELMRLGARPLAKEHLTRGRAPLNIESAVGIDVDVWFSEGSEIFHAARAAFDAPDVDAVIYVSMFNCGFDAQIEDLVEKRVVAGSGKPFLHLVLDEHASKVNVVSRLEVFMDVVAGRMEAAS